MVIYQPREMRESIRSFIRSLMQMGLRYKVGRIKNMIEAKYTEFDLVLGNGDKCTVRYCDRWGVSLFGNRTIHFEFRDCLSISAIKYKSEFRIVGVNEKIDPQESAKQIIEQITSIPLTGDNIQQKLL
jgi:hypothetical protein